MKNSLFWSLMTGFTCGLIGIGLVIVLTGVAK